MYMRYMILGLLLGTGLARAGTDLLLTPSQNPLIYNGAADAMAMGQPIGPAWVADGSLEDMCRDPSGLPGISRATLSPVQPFTGITTVIDGVTYQVFSTQTPGVGWVMGVKDTHATNMAPLTNTENQWYPAPGTTTNDQGVIGGESRLTLVKTAAHLATGITTIPAENVAQIRCYSYTGALRDSAYIRLNAVDINVTALGCEVTSGTSPVVAMGDHSIADFAAVGSTSEEHSTDIFLQCNAGVNVEATLSDQSSPGNTTDTLTLTADSTARGLGIQTLYNGQLLSYGPDNSSKGNLNQFFISSVDTEGQQVTLPLSFRYVRTGAMVEGSANGLVGVTFSYQ